MGAPTGRVYYGDFRLWREAYEPLEVPTRGLLQTFQGVDQLEELVVPSSPNHGLELQATCLGFPNPASATTKGWVALARALRRGLWDRSLRMDALVWVEDDTWQRTVLGYVAPAAQTSAAHGRVTGDVVYIRRPAGGAGLWTVAQVTVTAPDAFTLTALPGIGTALVGSGLYAIQPGDEVYLVESSWSSCAFAALEPMKAGPGGRWWAQEVVYRFRSSGRYSYARTTAAVGS